MSVASRRLAALFTLGLLGFYTPLLGAVNRPWTAWGIPVLPLYLFAYWAALVTAAGVVIRKGRR